MHPRGSAADAAVLDAVDVAAYYETIALRFARNAEEMKGGLRSIATRSGLSRQFDNATDREQGPADRHFLGQHQ